MPLFLLLAGCLPLFGGGDGDDDDDDDDDDMFADSGDVTDEASGTSLETTLVELDGSESQEVDVPRGGSLLAVESCDAEGQDLLCDAWEGYWRLTDDGRVFLEPTTWDGPLARILWLVAD